MASIFVARSAGLSDWASDVGLSKHVFKLGWCDSVPKVAVARGAWCGLTDWTLLKAQPTEITAEDVLVSRVATKIKMIDPELYPRLKGVTGIFKVTPQQVENQLLLARALAGDDSSKLIKPKNSDFAVFLINTALK